MARRPVLVFALALAACGAPPEPTSPVATLPPPVDAGVAPAPPVATLGEPQAHVVLRANGGEHVLALEELHAPPGDRALLGIVPTELLVLDDATLLVGATDGTLTAFDLSGRRVFRLGFRGAISGLARAGEGLAVVTTQRGVMALVSREGALRWERPITGERLGPPVVARDGRFLAQSVRGVFALTPGGEVAFSHAAPLPFIECDPSEKDCRPGFLPLSIEGDDVVVGKALRFRLDGPHTPVPSQEPAFLLTLRQVAPGHFNSVAATGPDEVTALEGYEVDYWNSWPNPPKQGLVRVAGGRASRVPVPDQGKWSHSDGSPRILPNRQRAREKPEKVAIVSDAIVTGPDDRPWVLARALSGSLTGGESGETGSWVGRCQIFDLPGGRPRERGDLREAFAEHIGVGTQLGRIAAVPEGRADLLCFGTTARGFAGPVCALYEGHGFRTIEAPAPVASVARIGDRTWLVLAGGEVKERRGDDFVALPVPPGVPIYALAGTSARDVWADARQPYEILHFDGAAWARVPVPVAWVGELRARAPDDAWAAGGGIHWDGQRWSVVWGAPVAEQVLVRGRADVWFAGAGLWHGAAPGPAPLRLPAPDPPDTGAAPSSPPLSLDADETRFAVERVSFAVAGGAPLSAATSVSVSDGGALLFRSWDRLVEVDAAGQATVRSSKKPAPVSRAAASAWSLGEGGELAPHAITPDGRPVLGIPAASWSAREDSADGGAWLAGGLNAGPSGEGILFQVRGRLGERGTRRVRVPAALLALAAPSPDEAWAVGAAGTVVHVEGAAVTRATLPSGEWLRAVHVAGPGDVWIGGDGGTLLHHDGRAFRPVPHPLGARAAFTAIASLRGEVWAVGPSGIVRVTKRR